MPSGYIALTDPEWYSFLAGKSRVDEVNFWQPHGGRAFRALRKGDPFIFKLRAPEKAIVGFGFFERFEVLPAWLAWDCFGEMNGASDFQGMLDRILRLRGGGSRLERSGDFMIGCIMIAAPVFFPREQWIMPPSDWARTGIQQGKTYQTQTGEGLHVLPQCLDRASAGAVYWNVERSPSLVAEGAERYGAGVTVHPRLGQGLFSIAVREAYGGACAVTREHSMPVLEAAHIKPYGLGGEHRIDNGILLRRDLHSLYDRGYVTVTPDYVFRVGDRLREEFSNGRSYYEMNGTGIVLPANAGWRPDRDKLAWHAEEVFKG